MLSKRLFAALSNAKDLHHHIIYLSVCENELLCEKGACFQTRSMKFFWRYSTNITSSTFSFKLKLPQAGQSRKTTFYLCLFQTKTASKRLFTVIWIQEFPGYKRELSGTVSNHERKLVIQVWVKRSETPIKICFSLSQLSGPTICFHLFFLLSVENKAIMFPISESF